MAPPVPPSSRPPHAADQSNHGPGPAPAGRPAPRDPAERLIVALDVDEEKAALELTTRLAGTVRFFKVGLELFTRAGPAILAKVRAAAGGAGVKLFLDLKFHDIPNTVARAVRAARDQEVEFLTLHLAGGGEMLRAAAAAWAEDPAAGSSRRGGRLLGVTVLTSQTEETLRETGVAVAAGTGTDEPPAADGAVRTQVLRLARLGLACGVGGLVASPLEIASLRRAFGSAVTLVIPGVRPAWPEAAAATASAGTAGGGGGSGDDQRRVLTPGLAIAAGADYLVVGRPVTRHPDPLAAARRLQEEIAAACAPARLPLSAGPAAGGTPPADAS